MLILGFNGGVKFAHEEAAGYRGHDSSAVLMRDGEVLAAIEEERLIRLKAHELFPGATADPLVSRHRRCRLGRYRPPGDEYVAGAVRTARPARVLDRPRRAVRMRDRRDQARDLVRSRVRGRPSRTLDCVFSVITTWRTRGAPSCRPGFDRSLILSIDGAGDDTSGMVLLGREPGDSRGCGIYTLPQSARHFYLELIRVARLLALRRVQGHGPGPVRRCRRCTRH